jgi:hypothetical protein
MIMPIEYSPLAVCNGRGRCACWPQIIDGS